MSKKSNQKKSKSSTSSDDSKPSDSKVKQKINVFDEGWEQKNSVIFYNDELKIWYCPKCDEEFGNGIGVSRHSKDVHGVPYKENEEPEVPKKSVMENIPNIEERLVGEKDSAYYLRVAENAEKENKIETDGEFVSAVYNLNRQKLSKSAAEIVNNPWIMYVFAESKKQKIISPYIDFGPFMENCVQLWVDQMQIVAKFEVDPEAIKKQPNLARLISNVKKDWEEFEETHGKLEAMEIS